MDDSGDSRHFVTYCNNCGRETKWTLIERVFHYIWKCLECGAERVASNRI